MSVSPFLAVSRISKASFSKELWRTRDQLCCSSEVKCILGDETISKCLYNLFLAVQQIRRATLAGFSETNGVVYAKFHK